MSSTNKINWGILGAGNIAKQFAAGVPTSKTGKLVAIGSRSIEKANTFADQFNIPNRHGSYEELLADKEVHAIYIATPHTQHPEWAIKAIRAGKHVLCEKPIGLNHAQAQGIIEEARNHNVLLMEAFMYRCHPQIAKVIELLKEKAIGNVRMITGSFGFGGDGINPESRLFNAEFGGGGILDVGCYPVSGARLFAGAVSGKPFLNPTKVTAAGHIGETSVDEWTAAILEFENGVVAQVSTAVRCTLENNMRIMGSQGNIVIPNPWVPSRDGKKVSIFLTKAGKTEEIEITPAMEPDSITLYGREADFFANALPNNQATSPAMSWDDTLGNMETLDKWRAAIGLTYPSEKFDNINVLHGGKLKVSSKSVMKYATIKGLDKKLSRFIMGCDNQNTDAHAAMIFDYYIEQGGNTFDTAHIYGGGAYEKRLGSWMKSRGIRNDVTLIAKGAHTPNCNPAALTKQLNESLERLQTDHADIYIMHRDNLDVPVGEFIDVMDVHAKAGRFKIFGGSNWTIARIQEANVYAKKNNKQGMSVLSNNFSLARMLDPIWAGCVSASDDASKKWLEENQFPVLSWSSQARGFFTDRAGKDKTSDAELVRVWYSDDNFKRRERAIELGKKKGVTPINIAAAYVLNQPFPTFALIGPRLASELTTSMPGLTVELTPDEVKWLDLQD